MSFPTGPTRARSIWTFGTNCKTSQMEPWHFEALPVKCLQGILYWPHWQPEFLRTLRRGLRNQPNTSGWGKINDHSGAITSHGCLPWAEGSSKTCHLANPFLFEVSEDTRTWGRKCQEVWMHLKHSEVSALYWEAEMCWTMTNQQNDFHTSSKIQTGSSQFCNAQSVGAAWFLQTEQIAQLTISFKTTPFW